MRMERQKAVGSQQQAGDEQVPWKSFSFFHSFLACFKRRTEETTQAVQSLFPLSTQIRIDRLCFLSEQPNVTNIFEFQFALNGCSKKMPQEHAEL